MTSVYGEIVAREGQGECYTVATMDTTKNFTKRANHILSLAQEEARRFRQNDVGTEHLLLGLIRDEGSIASYVLRTLGVEQQRIEEIVTRLIPPSSRPAVADPSLTLEAQRALGFATVEAQQMGNYFVGTEHLLLGLVRLKQGVVIDILNILKITPEAVRREVRIVVSTPPPPKNETTVHN